MIGPASNPASFSMNSHLFVYGTLLSRAGHPMGARLRREARLIGEACTPGRLYRIAHYPGLVETPDPGHLVHGELYALGTPAVTLKWLDAYEGLVPGNPALSQYERVERRVELAAGGVATAWVYVYRQSVRLRPEVPGGRWMAPPV
jgi:gamma-glutamylcyclotransferase (GGCT)/AIG2-like uncharacterized protein YtfP